MSAINEAVDIMGSQAALARRLHISASTVNEWVQGARQVPTAQCVRVERITQGRVTADALRADVNWLRIPDPSWPHPKGRPLVDLAPELTRGTSEQVAA